MKKLLWKPSDDRIEQANITKFIEFVNQKYGLAIKDYRELHSWSVTDIENFWAAIWDFVGIIHSKPYEKVVENLKDFPPKTQWFTGARLNFAENLLRYDDDQNAFVFKREDSPVRRMTFAELKEEVRLLHLSLKELGIQPGDRIVGYMPNTIETVIAMLAATSLGAVWASCGAELGADAALDRLGQVEPKVLFTADAYIYKGKTFDLLEKATKVAEGCNSIQKVVVLPYVSDRLKLPSDQYVEWGEFVHGKEGNLEFVQLPFSHPLFIMFSSGTTGKPKCMVQSAGGVLINHMKELVLHTDLKRDDTIFYITSPSWMMWNWLVSSLAVGATVGLYDGNPMYPSWKVIFEFIQDENITIFGCSASYIHALIKLGARPGKEFDLSALREISQTGSALSEEGFDFVYSEIKQDLHFNSISGGTDINGCFAAGSPTLPVYQGELQALALGMNVKAYDYDMNPIFDEQGELVCETPSPSMPIYFWNDPDNEKYHKAYFDFFKGKKVWRHGDYVLIHKDTGGITFYGRSDAVLKPSGVRIGTAEIYNIVEEMPEIVDSLAIGRNVEGDQEILLFVQLAQGVELTEELKKKIRENLRTRASPRHVPSRIIATPDIPYTFSGKKVESAVTNIINGRPVTNRGALRNPESLDFYEEFGKSL